MEGQSFKEVGTKQANELGLYDMSGNVAEWCWDWHSRDEESERDGILINPKGPESGSFRLCMGMAIDRWSDEYLNPRTRDILSPDLNSGTTGLRLIRSAFD